MQKWREKLLTFRVSEGQDPQAYAELYQLYFDKLRRFIFFKVDSPDEADDLTSQVFLKAWEYLTDPEKRRVQDFQAFMYQLARNTVIDFYRKQGRAPELVTFDDQEEEAEIPDYRQDFFLTQLYRSDRAYLADCLKRLKEEYREAVILRFLDELGISEIAGIMGKTPGNVRVLIHRGLKALRNVYDERQSVDRKT